MLMEIFFGLYSKIPQEQCVCICRISVEDLFHYVTVSPLYLELRQRFLNVIIDQLQKFSDIDKLTLLLSDVDLLVSHRVALLALTTRKVRPEVVLKKAAQ